MIKNIQSRNKKKGLFLSVELIVVVIILALIVAIVVAGMGHLLKMYKIYRMSKDISMYSEAILSFKNTYEYFPGDVPSASLTGVLNNTTLKANIVKIEAEAVAANSGVSATYDKAFGNGRISPAKGMTSFASLAIAGLIPVNGLDITTAITSVSAPGMDFSKQAKWTAPIASFDKSLFWSILMDVSTAETNYVKGSVVYNSVFPSYADDFSGNPRLVLAKYTDAPSGTSVSRIDNTAAFGALAANIAAALDAKIDDGLPLSGRMISEDIVATGGKGCLGVALPATPVLLDFTTTSNKYKRNAATDSLQSCLVTVVVQS